MANAYRQTSLQALTRRVACARRGGGAIGRYRDGACLRVAIDKHLTFKFCHSIVDSEYSVSVDQQCVIRYRDGQGQGRGQGQSQLADEMGTDFKSCRFDYRNFCMTTSGEHVDQAATSDLTADRARCSTLYSCKICGCLLRSRSDRKTHVTLAHRTAVQRTCQRQPDDRNHQSVLLLGLRSVPLVMTNHPSASSSELTAVNLEFLRSSFVPHLHQSSESLMPSAGVSLESCDVDTDECRPAVTSSSLCFRSYDDSTSGIVLTSCPVNGNTFDRVSSSSKVLLDLTADSTSHNKLPVMSRDVANNSDLRQRKSRVLDVTIQKLWRQRLQQQHSVTDEAVTFCDFETSLARNNTENFVRTSERRSDDDGGQRPGFEAPAVCDVTGSRSRGQGQARTERLVVDHHTSLMREQSTCRRKPQHVSHSLTYLLTYLFVYVIVYSLFVYHKTFVLEFCEVFTRHSITASSRLTS